MEALRHIPPVSQNRIALHIKPAAARAIRQGHPWLFDQGIKRKNREGRPGDLAVIFDQKDRFLAIGLYDPHSPIRVRVLQHKVSATIDQDWFKARLETAAKVRQSLPKTETTGYRLVHGENDGLPGLVIDRYGQSLVVKLDTTAWLPHLVSVLLPLLESLPVEQLVLRLGRHVQERTDALYGLRDGQIIAGSPVQKPVLFQENGLWFEADLKMGQKTGFFLDQRENRARVKAIVRKNSDIKRVLNVFSYSGGFSIYAASGGAKEVLDVDLSQPALTAAKRNLLLNAGISNVNQTKHETICGNAFRVLAHLTEAGRQFDMVIVDPPSFARRQSEVGRALHAYGRLVQLGLAVLRLNGVFVMSSCSSRVNAEDFFSEVQKSAASFGNELIEIVRTGHPIDHPVAFPEGAYLKCLFAIAK